jgi:hypothetical protein
MDLLKTTEAFGLIIDPRVRFRADKMAPCVSADSPYKSPYTASFGLIAPLTPTRWASYLAKNSPYNSVDCPLRDRCNHVSLQEIIASPGSIMWAWMQIMGAGGTRQSQ